MKLKTILPFIILMIINQSCDGQKKQTEKNVVLNKEASKMKNAENSNFSNQISILKKSMIEYMKMSNVSYSKSDVQECEKILTEYIAEIKSSKSKDEGMKIVQNTVEKLNNLNQKTEHSLIETSEREQIAGIIILASSEKDYNRPDEDITENWREW